MTDRQMLIYNTARALGYHVVERQSVTGRIQYDILCPAGKVLNARPILNSLDWPFILTRHTIRQHMKDNYGVEPIPLEETV